MILEFVVKQFQQLGASANTLAFTDLYFFPPLLAITLYDQYMIRD